tara:strand:- start:2000 stop:2326 length:327 start_codon:yes stop_codon:yes gene_type:complete
MGNLISKKKKKNSTLIINNDLIINITVDGKIYNKNKIYLFSFRNSSTFMFMIHYNDNNRYLRNILPTEFQWYDDLFIIKYENIKIFMTNVGYNKIKDYFNSHYSNPVI